MAKGHAASGVLVSLGVAEVTRVMGVGPSTWPLVLGVLVTAGAALLPDLDHPSATIARSLGPVTYWLSRLVAWLADGHRRRTHTWPFAVLTGVTTALVGWLVGRWGVAVVVFLLTSLGLRAVLTHRVRYLGVPVAAGLAVAAWLTFSPTLTVVVAVATALGSWTHCLGDSLTNSGCAWAWPCRRKLGTPRWLRFDTGGAGERRVTWGLATGSVTLVALLVLT